MKAMEDTEDAEIFISQGPLRPRGIHLLLWAMGSAVEADEVAAGAPPRLPESRRRYARTALPADGSIEACLMTI